MKTTMEYFDKSKEELKKVVNEYGYTKEECMLLDAAIKVNFYNNDTDSAEGANWLRSQGYTIETVLKMTDDRIAVLSM